MTTTKDKETTSFQDRCLALRPILGNQVDQIWQCYLFQDEEGKEELEQQLELMVNSALNTDVQNRAPVFLPPPPAAAAGELFLGNVVYNRSPYCPFGLRQSEMFNHVGIFGQTGTGKTNVSHLLASQIHKQGIPVWVLEFKRGWRELRSLPEFHNLKVFTVGRHDIAPISFNPLIPVEGVDPHTWIKKISHTISHAFFLGQGVLYLLEVTLARLYEEFGVFTGKPNRYPTFRDLLRMLHHYPIKSGRETLWLSSALRAIHSLCFGQMDRIVNTDSNDSLKSMIGDSIIFEMDSLGHEDKVFFTECIMLWAYEYLQARQVREKLQMVMFLEEAHNIAGRQGRQDSGSQVIVDQMFRQAREYGLGLVVIDQMPSAISKTALANVHCMIAMGVKERSDAVALSGSMLLDKDQEGMLGRLTLGTAIVRLQRKGIADPFLLHTPLVPVQKGTMTDEMLHMAMQPFVRYAEELEKSPISPSHPKLSDSEQAFLKDVALKPDSGVVARYTRLGLSGRQGDKAKHSLIDLGLVEEVEQLTSRGRSKIIRLTEKGRAILETLLVDPESQE